MILNNPLIRRYRYSLMRPWQLWVYGTIYVSVVAIILFLGYTTYEYREWFGDQARFYRSIFCQFLFFQAIILWVVGVINSGSAIRDEITGRSYDFFRVLPISAGKKAVGILFGKNLVMLLLAGFNFLFLGIFGHFGQLSSTLLAQSFFALISLAVLCNSVALLSSIRPADTKRKSHLALFVVFCVIFGPFLVPSAFMLVRKFNELENVTGSFYGVELPILILVGLIALYFGGWSIQGILRRFTREDEPLFTRFGAYVFMLGYEVVLFGLLYRYLTDEGVWKVDYLYWVLSLVPLAFIAFGALRSFENYLEHSGRIRSESAGNGNIMSRMLLYSNLSLDVGLFVVWAICSMGTTLIAGPDVARHLYVVLVLFSFYLFLTLLLELHVVYTSVSNKVGLLLGFLAAVYVILPLILSGILESEKLYLHSPVGFIFSLFREPHGSMADQGVVLAANLIFCIVPILLVRKRYLHILSTRRQM